MRSLRYNIIIDINRFGDELCHTLNCSFVCCVCLTWFKIYFIGHGLDSYTKPVQFEIFGLIASDSFFNIWIYSELVYFESWLSWAKWDY